MPQDLYIDFSLDRETHLPVKVSYSRMKSGEEGSWTEITLSEYVDVNGIKVPSKTDTDRIVVRLNVDYDEELFSKPPSIAAGPEAWRVRKSK